MKAKQALALCLLAGLFLVALIPAGQAIPATPHDFNRPVIVTTMSSVALLREEYISDDDIDTMIDSNNAFQSELPLVMRDLVIDLDESSFGKECDMTPTDASDRLYGVGYWVPNTTLDESESGITAAYGFEPVSAGGHQANLGFTLSQDEDATVEYALLRSIEDGDTQIAIDSDTYVYFCFQFDAASYNASETQYLNLILLVQDSGGSVWSIMFSATAVSGTDGWNDLSAQTADYYDLGYAGGIAGGARYIDYGATADRWYAWTFNVEDLLDAEDNDFGANVASIVGWGASIYSTKSDAETAYVHVRNILIGDYEDLNILNNLSDSEETDTGTEAQDFLNCSSPGTGVSLTLEDDRWEVGVGTAFHTHVERLYLTSVEVEFTPQTQLVTALDSQALTATISYTVDTKFGSDEPFYGKEGTYYINMTNLDQLHQLIQLTVDGEDYLEADGDIDPDGCSALVDEDGTSLTDLDDIYKATTDEPIRWTPATALAATNLLTYSVKFKVLSGDLQALGGGIVVTPGGGIGGVFAVIGAAVAGLFTFIVVGLRRLFRR